MHGFVRWGFAATASALAAVSWGQFGGGGSGIGRDTDLFVKQHILTPGDRAEWPIQAKADETFIVDIESDVFDAAVEFVDANGKVLAENDDIRPGEQQAHLVVRVPRAGAFKAVVKSYKSAAGGRYEFRLRRFVAVEAGRGVRTLAPSEKGRSTWVRLGGKAGETLIATVEGSGFIPDVEVVPARTDSAKVVSVGAEGNAVRTVFRVSADGDYYLRVDGRQQGMFALTSTAARVASAEIGKPAERRRLEPGGIDLWTLEGKAGDLLEIDAGSPMSGLSLSVDEAEPRANVVVDGSDRPFLVLDEGKKDRSRLTVLLNQTGKFQVMVAHDSRLSLNYGLRVARAPQSLDAKSPPLPLGESHFYGFEGTKGEIVQLEAQSLQFDPTITLRGARGGPMASDDDGGGGKDASLTLVLPETGRYWVQVGAFGNGGSGDYSLRKTVAPIRPLEIGTMTNGAFGMGGTEIWSIRAKAGQRLVFSLRGEDVDPAFRIVSPEGFELGRSAREGGDVTASLLSVRIPADGAYTVWVTGGRPGGRYRLRAIDLDK